MDRRILLLLTDLEIGGTPTVVREIARRLHRPPGVEIQVACLKRAGPVADQIRPLGIRVTALHAESAKLRTFDDLIRFIRRQKFDTVMSFLVHANVAAAVSSMFCPGVRFIQSIQTTQRRPHWHWLAQRWASHHAHRVIVPSPSAAEVAHYRSVVPMEKLLVIPNGVDVPPSRAAHPFGRPPHRVVFIGRLDPVKRLPDLLAAVHSLNGLVHLDIYGDGAQREKLIDKIQEREIAAWVTMHGPIDGPEQALRDAELLVLPSEAEGFGLVLIEAMAAGVPVVATNAPGIRDVVRDKITGLLVPVGSPADLATAMRQVLEDPAMAQRLSAAAWGDVRQRFTWDAAMDGYRRLLGI
ncbi:MAG TPA: glycosyltransferase family 4 protein [Tepidisphaeraceae bacterium]|nr:glycosyltransferase family 4 protein [Tepidisphaeraceae bacterium]